MGLQKFAFALAFMFSILSPAQDAKAETVDCAEKYWFQRMTYYSGSCFNYQPDTIDIIQIYYFVDQDLIDAFKEKGYKSGDVYVDFELIDVSVNKQASCSDYDYTEALARNFFNAESSEKYRLSLIISNKPISGPANQFTGYIISIATIEKSKDGSCQAREVISDNLEVARIRAVADDDLYVNVIFSAESSAGYNMYEIVTASAVATGKNISGVFSQVAPFLDPVLNFDTSSETFSSRQTRIDAFAGQANATTGLEVVITFGQTEFARFKLIQKISEQGVLQDKTSFSDAALAAEVAFRDVEYKPLALSLMNILRIEENDPNFKEIGASLELLDAACERIRRVASKYEFSNLVTRKLLALMMFEFYKKNRSGLESSDGHNVCLLQGERNLYWELVELVKTAPQAPRQCPTSKSNPVVSHVRAMARAARMSLDDLLAKGIVDLGELWRYPDDFVPIDDQIRSVLGRVEPNRCAINVGGENSHGRGTPECTYLTSMVRDDDTRVWVAFDSDPEGNQIEIQRVVIGADPLNYTALTQPFEDKHPDCQTWWAEAVPAG